MTDFTEPSEVYPDSLAGLLKLLQPKMCHWNMDNFFWGYFGEEGGGEGKPKSFLESLGLRTSE